jgi:hypothetical protein
MRRERGGDAREARVAYILDLRLMYFLCLRLSFFCLAYMDGLAMSGYDRRAGRAGGTASGSLTAVAFPLRGEVVV